MKWKIHNQDYFVKHCEIVNFLLSRKDKYHPAVKHHIRAAIREASNHVGFSPGSAKHSARYISKRAIDAMRSGQCSELIAEHVVPVSEINKLIINSNVSTTEQIVSILEKYAIRAVITSPEDRKLHGLGLSKVMPQPLSENTIMSRYEVAEIVLEDNCYSKLLKGCKEK